MRNRNEEKRNVAGFPVVNERMDRIESKRRIGVDSGREEARSGDCVLIWRCTPPVWATSRANFILYSKRPALNVELMWADNLL